MQALEQVSPQFRQLWQQHDIHGRCQGQQHDIHGRCQGQRTFKVPGVGQVTFEHASFIADEENHLRLVMYSALAQGPASAAFEALLQS
ncbi:MmyB family transcriptional regulator [Serratia sp. NA_13]|uniref:MmyB family transcriptional regulator n=1 Tax=Serratia sp. NA_13 TaxID=3415658 RepID=UPI0040470127